jgi:hypothetical protein
MTTESIADHRTKIRADIERLQADLPHVREQADYYEGLVCDFADELVDLTAALNALEA